MPFGCGHHFRPYILEQISNASKLKNLTSKVCSTWAMHFPEKKDKNLERSGIFVECHFGMPIWGFLHYMPQILSVCRTIIFGTTSSIFGRSKGCCCQHSCMRFHRSSENVFPVLLTGRAGRSPCMTFGITAVSFAMLQNGSLAV